MGVTISNMANVAAGAVLAIQPAVGQETKLTHVGSAQWIPKVAGDIQAAIAAAGTVDFQPAAPLHYELRGVGCDVRNAGGGPDVNVGIYDAVALSDIFVAGEAFNANGPIKGLVADNANYIRITMGAGGPGVVSYDAVSIDDITPLITVRLTNGVLTSDVLQPGQVGPWDGMELLLTNTIYAEIVNEAAVAAVLSYTASKAN